MSKVLILEDDQNRIDEFAIHLVSHTLVFESTSKGALETLLSHKEPFDYIFLDHDLDEDNTCVHGEGIDVVEFIVANPGICKNTLFIIHSMNPVGAENMAKVLKRASFEVTNLPYSWIVWNKWQLNLSV